MKLTNQLTGLIWVGISVIVCADSIDAGIGTVRSPGPGFLPFWSGVILGLLGLTLAVTKRLRGETRTEVDIWKGAKWGRLALVIISIILYVFLLEKLGYLIASSLLTSFLFCVAERGRIWIKIILSIIIVFTSYVIFQVWLRVNLPKGLLDF